MNQQNQSIDINEIAKALSLLQVEIQDAHKDKQGYGYKYADLGQILEIIRPLLFKHKLSIAQMPAASISDMVSLRTKLMHISGQWIESEITMPVEVGKGMSKAQAYGSVITYARRYALAAMLSITQTDNDAAVERNEPVKSYQPTDHSVGMLETLIKRAKVEDSEILLWLEKASVENLSEMKPAHRAALIKKLSERLGE